MSMNPVKHAHLSSYRDRHQQKMQQTATSQLTAAKQPSSEQPKLRQETVQQVGVGQGRIRSASSNKQLVSDESGQAAWEAATAKARQNRAPSHPPQARSAATGKQPQPKQRTSVTASQGFGAGNQNRTSLVEKQSQGSGKPGISALQGTPNKAARTGMPTGMNRPKKGGLSGDFNSQGDRQTILSSGANGTGLWVHQSASVSKIEGPSNGNLPPIKSSGSMKGTPQNTNKPPRQNGIANVELQAERNLTSILEKKYQEAMKESDAAQIRCEKAIFEGDILRKDKLELQNENSRLTFDLRRAQQRVQQLEAGAGEKDEQLRRQYEALENQGMHLMETQQEREKLINALEFERGCRQQDIEARDAEVRDLQDQVGEYEEETMKLQNQLYQMQLEVRRLQDQQQTQPSPAKSITSKASAKQEATPKQATPKQANPAAQKASQAAQAASERSRLGQDSYDNTSDMEGVSQMRRNFNEAFETTEVPVMSNDTRVTQLEDQLKQMRQKLKKEELSRKSYQDIARRKDEEIKKAQGDTKQVETKLKEECERNQKQKTMIMQRDNKITVLESKLGGGGSAQKSNAPAASNQNLGKQREIGKAFKTPQEAQRVVIESIKKPGQSTGQENTPKSILRKPGAVKTTPQRATKIQTRPPVPASASKQPLPRPSSRQSSKERNLSANRSQVSARQQNNSVERTSNRPPSRSSSQGRPADLMVEVDEEDDGGKVPGEDDEPDMGDYGEEEELVPIKAHGGLFGADIGSLKY